MIEKLVWGLQHVLKKSDCGVHLNRVKRGDFAGLEVLVENLAVNAMTMLSREVAGHKA